MSMPEYISVNGEIVRADEAPEVSGLPARDQVRAHVRSVLHPLAITRQPGCLRDVDIPSHLLV